MSAAVHPTPSNRPAHPEPSVSSERLSKPPAFDSQALGFQQSALSAALYGLMRHREGNLVFSPLGITIALAMALAGAKAETADGIRTALCWHGNRESLRAALSGAVEVFFEREAHGNLQRLVISVWTQQGAPLEDEFVRELNSVYRAGSRAVDFVCSADSIRKEINQSIESATNGLIRQLLSSGVVTPNTRLMLVNALYFKQAWMAPFDPDSTRTEPFYVDQHTAIPVKLMHQTKTHPYVQGDGFQAISLGYADRETRMLILLPDARDGLPALEARLSVKLLLECLGSRQTKSVSLVLPRFRAASNENLNSGLIRLGMEVAFDQAAADFSGINGASPPSADALFVTEVIHGGVVEVTEEGTEAAAATVLLMDVFGIPSLPVVFRADHPFLFVIQDRLSEAILFIGRCVRPEP